jgi:hypothetical protein
MDRLGDFTHVNLTVTLKHQRKIDIDRFEKHVRTVDGIPNAG